MRRRKHRIYNDEFNRGLYTKGNIKTDKSPTPSELSDAVVWTKVILIGIVR